MPWPLAAWVAMALMGGGQAASAVASSRNNRKNADAQRMLTEEQNAIEESALNPFRHANAQGRSIMELDRRVNTSPRERVMGPNGFERLSGGQYSMSPEVAQWLTELRNRIAAGQAQNPGIANRYRTSIGDLRAPLPQQQGHYAVPRPRT